MKNQAKINDEINKEYNDNQEREKKGPFKDYVDAVCRLINCGIDRNVIENLIYAGAFDMFNYSRHTMIENLNNVILYANAHKGQMSMQLDYDDSPIIKELKDDKLVSAENEKNVLGFYFSFNPIMDVKKKYNIDTDNLYNISNSFGNVSGFGMIQRVKEIKARKGDLMAFVDLVDDSGNLSLAIMPRLYGQYSSQLVKGKYIKFTGNIEKENSCLVKSMEVI